ncbi:hypothetical protein BC830DRAFT_1078746 [Chytriomyces sp. MP71]|nr:hypothetical protein BC830DRAFT_1078746 [Chytriomyces sp. MP71]
MNLDSQDWLFGETAVVITGIGFCINVLVIVSNVRYILRLPSSSVIILCLCASDTVGLINYFASALIRLVLGNFEYDARACQIQSAMITFSAINSLGLCAGLTLSRYLVIVRSYKMSQKLSMLYISGVALFCIFVSVIPFIANAADRIYGDQASRIGCTVRWYNTSDFATRVMAWTCVAVLAVPFSSIGFCYFTIYLKVHEVYDAIKHVRSNDPRGNSGGTRTSTTTQRASMPGIGNNSSAPDAETGRKSPMLSKKATVARTFTVGNQRVEEKKEVILRISSNAISVLGTTGVQEAEIVKSPRTASKKISRFRSVVGAVNQKSEEHKKQMALLIQSIVLVSVFLGGWTPYLAFAFYEMFTGSKGNSVFGFAVEMLVYIQNGVNPIIVLVFDKNLKQNFLKMLRLQKEEFE